ncbi:hypothetical protein QF047_001560 [Arthrobacter sp. W4I7]|nr:hypothetical protein [Arthrobacter sp. W4I7]
MGETLLVTRTMVPGAGGLLSQLESSPAAAFLDMGEVRKHKDDGREVAHVCNLFRAGAAELLQLEHGARRPVPASDLPSLADGIGCHRQAHQSQAYKTRPSILHLPSLTSSCSSREVFNILAAIQYDEHYDLADNCGHCRPARS